MGIKDLFHWLQNDEESFLFSDQTVTQELLKHELLQAEAIQQQLIREVRIAKLFKEDATEKIRALEQHERFMHYLQFCTQTCSDRSLLLISLNYLLSQPPKENSPISLALKVKSLFLMLLQENQEHTLDFYEKNKILFKEFPELRKLVAQILFAKKITADVELTQKKTGDVK